MSRVWNIISPCVLLAVFSTYVLAENNELEQLKPRLADLNKTITELKIGGVDDGLLADAEIGAKAVTWMIRHPEEIYKPAYAGYCRDAIALAERRCAELKNGTSSWAQVRGHVARAYRSRVDGSVQPYGLIIPVTYDGKSALRLDLILHGRNGRLTEASFLHSFRQREKESLGGDTIELHVFGRTNNAYRWSGETDVFEALESVKARYRIDERRIVLRGFSMGGAGAWHIGLHYPHLWAAVEAGAGFSETVRYARLPNLPRVQRRALEIYDAASYARNVLNVPFVGYGGEIDKQLQAARNIQDALVAEGFSFESEGLDSRGPFLLLVGPKTAHKFHPDSKMKSSAFIDERIAVRAARRDEIDFVTYTTSYPRCDWIVITGLEEHYRRARVKAVRLSREFLRVETRNVSHLRIEEAADVRKLDIDGKKLDVAGAISKLRKDAGVWSLYDGGETVRKRPGLQGPIDDAFRDSFFCVRGTGKPWNAKVQEFADQRLATFRAEYDKWLRADIRSKADIEVTAADILEHHLILFGDPGSNRLIAKLVKDLPIEWTRKELRIGGKVFDARDHLPAMIFPNPANPDRYVVLNSGHTFHEKDFRGTNAYLFPRLGDYAVFNIGVGEDGGQSVVLNEYFDEEWKLKKSRD